MPGRNHRVAAHIAVAILLSSVTRADDDATAKARACFERGRSFYEQARYEDAVREFRAGYELAPRPLFLVNLGQAYRQLGRLDEAREEYRRFLAEVPPDDPQRAGVEHVVTDLDRKIAARDAERERARLLVATPPTVVAAAPKKKPFIKRYWWIIPVGATAVTAIVLGAVLGTRARSPSIDCTGATLGCVQ